MRWKRTGIMMMLCLVLALLALPAQADAAAKYKIRINKQQNTVTVYRKNASGYKPYKAFVCSVGDATPLGSFQIHARYRWRPLVESTYGQYATRIVGRILFHSVWYDRQDVSRMSKTEFNKLGTKASHGCIRLCVRDAKWIYDHCANGTQVEIYNAKDPGPLGKPVMSKVSGKWGYDPTDIWSKANPYNKKKPKITGAKNQKISYGLLSYQVMAKIRGKGTTGQDATNLVTCQIRYSQTQDGTYRKVKAVNTRKPGFYKITYGLTDEIGRKAKKVTVIHQVMEAEKQTDIPPIIETAPIEP